jgi:hypothetical protein
MLPARGRAERCEILACQFARMYVVGKLTRSRGSWDAIELVVVVVSVVLNSGR